MHWIQKKFAVLCLTEQRLSQGNIWSEHQAAAADCFLCSQEYLPTSWQCVFSFVSFQAPRCPVLYPLTSCVPGSGHFTWRLDSNLVFLWCQIEKFIWQVQYLWFKCAMNVNWMEQSLQVTCKDIEVPGSIWKSEKKLLISIKVKLSLAREYILKQVIERREGDVFRNTLLLPGQGEYWIHSPCFVFLLLLFYKVDIKFLFYF